MLGSAMVAAMFTLGADAAAAASFDHDGDVLVRVRAWPDEVHELGLDVWTHRTARPVVLARVTPEQQPMLDASGWSYVVVEPDLGARLAAERDRLTVATPVLGGGLDPSWYDDYRPLDGVFDRLDALIAARPDRVSAVELGLSLEGRTIRGIRVTNPGGPDDRPVVVVVGALHAREWITVASTVFVAERFATSADGSADDALLDEVALVVVPVANPDGYVYSWDFERLWRKNRRDGIGVDLNRNWGVQWGGEGASAVPEEGNYHGEGPFSEPETVALRDFIDAQPEVLTMLDVHAFGQLVLYPWGYETVDSEDDARFDELANDLSDAMWAPHEQWYTPLQSADFYPAAGNSADWAYGVHGIHALALELRPTFMEGWGFMLPPQFIVPTAEELLAAVRQSIDSTLELGPGAPGDSDGGQASDDGGDTTEGGSGGSGGFDGSTGQSGTGGLETGAVDTGPNAASSGEGPPLPGGTGAGSETGTSGEPEAGADGDAGCGCRSTGEGPTAWWLLVPALLWRRRR